MRFPKPVMALALIGVGALAACSEAPFTPADTVDAMASDFVTLALQFGQFDENYVDAFTGADTVRDEALAADLKLEDLAENANALADRLESLPAGTYDAARVNLLKGNVLAMQTRMAMAGGKTFPFNEETRRIYGAVAPQYTLAQFEAAMKTEAAAAPRQDKIIIPADKVEAAMETAIAECRARTLAHYDLPETETFDMEFVTGKSWSAYNWYKGNYRSVIQINLDQPLEMDRVLDLGCHEGYPGHHVYNVMVERDRINAKNWIENTVVPLYSPSGPLMEGSGNYGLELAFPGEAKDDYARDVLFPLTGLTPPPPRETNSDAVKAAGRVLDFANIHAAREYLDGRMSREEAVAFLVKFNRDSESRAQQRVDFFETYRGYIINYTLGQHVIGDYIERRVAAGEYPWDAFKYILDTPLMLSDLAPE